MRGVVVSNFSLFSGSLMVKVQALMLFTFTEDFHYCAEFNKYAAVLLCSAHQICCSIIVLNSPNMLQYYCAQYTKYAAVLLC